VRRKVADCAQIPRTTSAANRLGFALQRAQQETYRRLGAILTGDCKARLDSLLTVDAETGRSNLAWLQQSATTYSPPMILATLEKWACCRQWGVDRWDLSSLTPNRLKFLPQIARRSTNQALDRILRNWNDLLRVAGSLKCGWVTSPLLIGKLQSYHTASTASRSKTA